MWYLALYGMFALWVLLDGIARKIGPPVVAWVLGTLLLGPIVLPVYLAKRPLKKGEVREGGTPWNVLKNFAILWTILMAMAALGALVNMGQSVSSLDSDAAGAGLGIILGMGFIAVLWFIPTVGAAVLGFLLKKNSIVENGPTGPLVGQDSPRFAVGWVGVLGSTILALIIFIAMVRATTKSVAPGSEHTATAPSNPSQPTLTTWTVSENVNPMDDTKTTLVSLSSQDEVQGFIGSQAASLVIKCKKGRTEAYVNVHTTIQHEYDSETYGVRVKFDDGAPVKQRWTPSTDGTALFSPEPRAFVKHLEDSTVFLFEFTPFEKTPTTVRFNVGSLSEKLTPISGCSSE